MRYKVKTSNLVVNEMARYDNATIIEMVEVDNRRTRQVKEVYANSPELVEQFTICNAILESERCTLPRWFAFGARPIMLVNNNG